MCLLFCLYLFLFPSLLFPHGFAKNTLVLCEGQRFKHINHIKNKTPIYSYNKYLDQHANIIIKERGYSTTNCYVNLVINDEITITCTPTQEFYHIQRKRCCEYCPSSYKTSTQHRAIAKSEGGWVPAYKLNVGDQLLCAHHTTQPITAIYPVNKSIKVYTIEVSHYHTFFVSPYRVLTHNMSLPCFADAGMGISTLASAGAVGSFFEPTTAIVGLIIAAAAYGIAKIIKSIKGTKYHQPAINDDALHHLKQKQRKSKKSKNKNRKSSNNNNKDPKKTPPIDNMEKFFLTEFGKKIYDCVEKTKKYFQGQPIYRVIQDIKGTRLSKGDQLYLDAFHKNHLEIFDKRGFAKDVLDLNGNPIYGKIARSQGRRLLL